MAEGYGADTRCDSSLRTGQLDRGVTLVMRALYRRLTTPRGTLQGLTDGSGDEEGAYGLDLAGYVGAVGLDIAVRALPSQIRAELLKDDRVSDVSVAVSASADGVITITIDARLSDESEDFQMTLRVQDATVVLVST